MLFKTALRNLKRNPLMNILSLLQLIAVLLIAGIMVSSLCIRYRTYSPFADILGSSGYYCTFAGNGANRGYGTGGRYFYNGSGELAKELGAVSVISTHSVLKFGGMVLDDEYVSNLELLSYDDEIIKRYCPDLKEGRWLSTDSDEIETVVSDSSYGWRVGDVITLSVVSGNAANINQRIIDVRVVGILDEGAEVYGLNRPFTENTYRIMYRPFYPEREREPVMLFSHSVLNSCDETIVQTISSSLITYDPAGFDKDRAGEGISKADGNYLSCLKDMNEDSLAYLQEQLLQLLPIVIVLMILVLVSSVSISALAARRRLRDYAKYYVVGLQWNQCVLVNLFQSLITAAAAVAVTVVALFIVQYTALSEMFMVLWNGWLLLALAGIVLLYLLFSMIMPFLMLRSVSPKQLLTAE